MKDFKIVFIPQVPGKFEFVKEYDELNEAVVVLNAITDYTLVLHKCSLMQDYSNAGMIYKNTGSYWIEIDDDGNEI